MKKNFLFAVIASAGALIGSPAFSNDANLAEATQFRTEWAQEDGFVGREQTAFIANCVAEELGQDVGSNVVEMSDDEIVEVDAFVDSDIDAELAE